MKLIKCQICGSNSIGFIFKNQYGTRYLKCGECELVFKESQQQYGESNLEISDRLTIEQFLGHIQNLVKTKLKHSFKMLDLENQNDEPNFFFSDKAIRILLKRNFYKNIEIKCHNNFLEVEAEKIEFNRYKISYIVPVYNEISNVENLLKRIDSFHLENCDKEIIIIESNSTDGSREVVLQYQSKPGYKVILQNAPRGKGNAVREGLSEATGEIIAIQDADDEYNLSDYIYLVNAINSGSSDFILGSRKTSNWNSMRKFNDQPAKAMILNFGQLFFTSLINLVTKSKLDDPFTMYKIFRSEVLNKVTLVSDRFDLDHEIVIKFINAGSAPREIPIEYNSRSFNDGKKVRLFADPINWLGAIFKFGVLKQ